MSTPQFEQELRRWANFRTTDIATDSEIATLVTWAQGATDAQGWTWAEMRRLMVRHTDLTDKEVANEVRRARCMAELGGIPHTARMLIPLWLRAKGFSMTYTGIFSEGQQERDTNYVLNEIRLWAKEIGLFDGDTIKMALDNWMDGEKVAALRRGYSTLIFDPTLDPDQDELRRFCEIVVAPVQDEQEHARNIKVAMVAFSNLIHRAKNHMAAAVGLTKNGKKRWTHSTHLMPILYGGQGTGKTTAVEVFLKPLADLYATVGFDVIGEDNSKAYQLSIMPVMWFDEMAGINKADTETLKGIMTAKQRMMREAYKVAGMRTVMSTFIGCSNRYVNDLIRDASGNRRFVQINTVKMDRVELLAIDALTIWKSVDEDALAPLYADDDTHAIIQGVQEEQRHKSAVEWWLEECQTIPWGSPRFAGQLMEESFTEYLSKAHRAEERVWNSKTLGQELVKLAALCTFDIEVIEPKDKNKSKKYIIRRGGGRGGEAVLPLDVQEIRARVREFTDARPVIGVRRG